MSTMTLKLPMNYVEIEREEMEYVDGGAPSVDTVGGWLDTTIWIGGVCTGLAGIGLSVREILKRNARGLVIQSTRSLLQKVGLSAGGFIVSSIVSGLDNFLDLSLGKAIAMVWGSLDTCPYDGEVDRLW